MYAQIQQDAKFVNLLRRRTTMDMKTKLFGILKNEESEQEESATELEDTDKVQSEINGKSLRFK